MEPVANSGTRFWGLATLALGTLLAFGYFGPLWHDELQSVTFARADLPHLVEAVGRFDFHPPYYYIFLHYWTEVSTELTWLRFSSIVFWLAGAAFLYVGARQFADGDPRAGLVAAVIFMVSPCVLRYATEVRMYMPWMMLTAGGWLGFFSAFRGERPGWGAGFGAACGVAASYVHGAGILTLGALLVYVTCQIWFHRDDRQRIAIVVWAILLALLAVSPILWSGHDTPGHVGVPALKNIVEDWSFAVVGFGYKPFWLQAVALVVAIYGPLALAKNREVWVISLGFIFAPVVAALLISVFVKPVWSYRTILFTSPMIGLCWSLVIAERIVAKDEASTTARYRLAVAVFGLLLVAAGLQRVTYAPQTDTFRAVKTFQEEAAPGAVIVPAHRKLAWTLGWYLAGPGQIDPLEARVRTTFGDGRTLAWSRQEEPWRLKVDGAQPEWFAIYVYEEADLAQFVGKLSPNRRFRTLRFGRVALLRRTVPAGGLTPK